MATIKFDDSQYTNITSGTITINTDGNVRVSSNVGSSVVTSSDMLKITGVGLDEIRKLSGIITDGVSGDELLRSRSQDEIDVVEKKLESYIKEKFPNGVATGKNDRAPRKTSPNTEELRKLEADNTSLRNQLAAALSDADRLRGGITEKKRYLRLVPAGGRKCEVEGKNYLHTILEIDQKTEHLLVYQDLEGALSRETVESLATALRKRFGKNVMLVVTRPGMELSALELTR